jgi:hypothetical protein
MKSINILKWVGVALIALISILAAPSAHAEEESLSSSEVDPNIEYVGDKLESALETIGEKLEAPAEHVYSILVRQQTIKAWYNLIPLVLVGITWLFIAGFWVHAYILNQKDSYEYDDWFFGWSIAGIISTVIFGCVIGGCIGAAVTGFTNPEYGALKDIFQVIS